MSADNDIMTKNEKQGMNRVENDMHTAQQTSMTGQGITHLLRTAILGLILTMGLSLGYGQAQAQENGKDTRQVQRHDREQADKGKGENRRADDALPSIVLAAPANNVSLYPASIAVDAAVSFPGKAEGRNGKREGVEIEFLVDGVKFAEVDRVPYHVSYTPPRAGIYTLSARIRYGEGKRIIQSNSVEIVSDLPPTVSLTAPANNTVLTAPATFTLTAGAAAQIGGIAKVEFYNGTTLIGTATGAPYTYTWNNVPAGSYTVTAKATDNYGISNTSAPVSVISNAAPTVSLTGPAPNTVSVAPGSFTLTANAADTDGTIAKVEFYNGATLIGAATTAPYSVTWSNVPAGNYTITAIATDNNGASTTSAAVPVISDAPPTVSLTGPAANAGYTTPSAITLDATAADSDGTITKVDFYNGATLLGTATAAPYSYTWNDAPVGTHTLTAVATDNLGASVTSAATTVTVIAPPVVSVAAPVNAVLTAPASFTLSANATSAGSIAKVEFYNGATLIGTATAAPYSITWSNVPAGSYSITAVATDGNGATTTSAPVSVTANAAPAVSLTSPAANSVLAAPASFTLTADATDTDGSIAQVDFYNGATLLGTATTAPYSHTWSSVPAGNYTITAVAMDNAGAKTTSAAVAVTVNPGIAQAYYIHTDHLDTPRSITDTSGNLVWQWDNTDPFGNNVPNQNPSGLGTFEYNQRFAGQYFDRETNTHYNVNRDYDPANGGRYLQSDPIGLAGGVNTYSYVGNNPLSYIDPLGLDKTIWWPPGPGRSITDGPRNGNWGGGKWSGGASGGGTGTAPALDSGDECYQRHDQCFDSGTQKTSCNRKLVDELKALPDDPKKWPRPPAPGTEGDSDRFRRGAIIIFGQ